MLSVNLIYVQCMSANVASSSIFNASSVHLKEICANRSWNVKPVLHKDTYSLGF
jgi:hypothetical protein